MKWEKKSLIAKINEKKQWHDCFAWWPITCETSNPFVYKVVWLEKVQRKRVYGRMGAFWVYREKIDESVSGLRNDNLQQGEPL